MKHQLDHFILKIFVTLQLVTMKASTTITIMTDEGLSKVNGLAQIKPPQIVSRYGEYNIEFESSPISLRGADFWNKKVVPVISAYLERGGRRYFLPKGSVHCESNDSYLLVRMVFSEPPMYPLPL
ncbi:hypothetical protein DFA_09493 [Cavenderia fasciculata]|uniref:Uncharacterized protein n=1 Tax=Cavenderia fasciculata TaxID=261658 RepID=F4Q7S4_CACFS|nr:uncharacterized protein DFA_09493 [Cavenderia fasciculata]EGG15824.1 hypothetical protein DFA_09493 [Cavenderia fasciculata]|eukprot:XP_004352149.1 hypothetical protein DFA_09493 [Cavenderia fasciculata]